MNKKVTIGIFIILVFAIFFINVFTRDDFTRKNERTRFIEGGVIDITVNSGDVENASEFSYYDNNNTADSKVFIDDSDGLYFIQNRLNIFDNVNFPERNKIAPGSNGIYTFKVHNATDGLVNYKLNIVEKSEYKVNMKYRLLKNNNYMIGDDNTWVYADEIIDELSMLKSNEYDEYMLDWRWFDDDENDNKAGINMESAYELKVKVYFEVI